MALVIKCPHCGEKTTVSARRVGNKARCTECQRSIQVPEGTVSKLLQMLKVTLWVLLLVAVLGVLHWLFDLNPHHWNWGNW
jgi:ribosomal protein S27E